MQEIQGKITKQAEDKVEKATNALKQAEIFAKRTKRRR